MRVSTGLYPFILLILCYSPVFTQSNNSAIKVCAILHSEGDFQGQSFTLVDHDQSPNLLEDYRTSQDGWNYTGSYLVSDNCELTVCPETYLDGECQSFKPTRNSSSLPFQPVSIKCECPRVCSCSGVKMEKTSCAKGFLNKGCKKCSPMYTDLKGRKSQFTDMFQKNITALKVREGCTLELFSEADMEGDVRTFGHGVVENFIGEIHSYDCRCSPGNLNTITLPPPPRDPNYPKLINVPSTLDEVLEMLKGNETNHPGLLASFRSLNGNPERRRSSRNAYILLLGTTGAGKSSSINLLFNSPNLTKTGVGGSVTSDIHEFRIPIPVDELGIANSELRVIDTPGLGDTRGLEQDAKFLATLDDYLASHEELSHRIPNIVLIYHKFHDNRYEGDGSKFVQMLAGLDKFKTRITDDKYSNVIFVFSHFLFATKDKQRQPGQKIADFKAVIESYSMFPRPTIITVAENQAAEQDMPMVNGYFKLPNNEYYPRNLFDKMEMITTNTNDAIGQAVIRTAFRDSDNFNISRTEFKLVTSKSKKVSDYFNVLKRIVFDIADTPVSRMLAEAYETMNEDLQKNFGHSLQYLQKALSLRGINERQDIPKTNLEILELLTVLEQSPATMYLLQKLGISPPNFPSSTIAGYGYHVFKDNVLPLTPYNVSIAKPSDIGYLVPEMVACKKESATAQVFQIIPDQKKYIERRLASLGISGNIPVDKWKGVTKPGYNIRNNGSFSAGVTGSREVRLFQMEMTTNPQLSENFETSVRSLGALNLSDTDSIQRWNTFFEEYGTHVVKSVYGGGSIEISITSEEPFGGDVAQALFDIVRFGEDMSALAPPDNMLNKSQPILGNVSHSLIFRGGNSKYHLTDLSSLSMEKTAEVLSNWKKSLLYNPIMLTTTMELLPMSQVVKPMGNEFKTAMDQALKLLFDSNIIKVAAGTKAGILTPPPAREDTPTMLMMTEMMKKSNEQFISLMGEMIRISEQNSKRHAEIQMKIQILQAKEAEKNRKFQFDLIEMLHRTELDRLEFQQRIQKEKDVNDAKIAVLKAEADKLKIEEERKKKKAEESTSTSCLKEGTRILLADGSEKPVESLKPGDLLLDVDLKPAKVIGSTYEFLMDQSFYGFDNESFFFTNTHLMVGPRGDGKNLRFYAKSKSRLESQNPLMQFLDIEEFTDEPTNLFHMKVENGRRAVETQSVSVFQDRVTYKPDTKIYFLQVDSETGTYFANGYVCRHELPPLNLWSNTMASLMRLLVNPVYDQIASLPYQLKHIPIIRNVIYQAATKIRQELELDHGLKLERNSESYEYELMTLEDNEVEVGLRKLYENPMYAAVGVAAYAGIGPVVSPYIDGPLATTDKREIARVQALVSDIVSDMMESLFIQLQNA